MIFASLGKHSLRECMHGVARHVRLNDRIQVLFSVLRHALAINMYLKRIQDSSMHLDTNVRKFKYYFSSFNSGSTATLKRPSGTDFRGFVVPSISEIVFDRVKNLSWWVHHD